MDKNVKVLKEVCKGVNMGMESISYINDKIIDPKLKNFLDNEYSMYNNILDKVNDAFDNYDVEPGDASVKDKIMLWSGLYMNTLNDKSNSKISELLIQGTTMGIIEGRRLMNANSDLDKDVENLLNDFITFQEKKVEELKAFL